MINLGTDEELFMGPESKTVDNGEAAPTDPAVWIQMPVARSGSKASEAPWYWRRDCLFPPSLQESKVE